MKKLFKVSSYILATVLVLFISQVSALAASNTDNGSSLTGAQVVGGVAILLFAILVPTMKAARKSRA